MRKNLTEGPEWKAILLFSLPIMAGQLLQQLYNTADGIVVGNYVSAEALAAVGSCGSVAFLFLALAFGMSNGSGVVIAQFFGARREEELRRTAATALITLGALGVLLSVLGFVSAEFLMSYVLKVEDPSVHAQCVSYFRIYAVGLMFQFLYNAVAAILRSLGDSKASLYFLLVSALGNIVLDILLVAVIPWGVAGAALATVISQAACTLVSVIYMRRRYPLLRFRRKELVFDKEKFLLCLRMGIPTSVQQLVISGGNVLLQRLVNSFGPAVMAAYTAGNRFDFYVTIPVMGFFNGMAAFAGQNTGAGKPERIRRGLGSVLLMDVVTVAALGSLTYTFAPALARLFGVEGDVLDKAVELMRFMSFLFPLFALYIPFNGMFQGCGDAVHAMIVSLIALSLKVVGAYGMVYLFGFGYAATWQSNIIGWGGACVFSIAYYFSGRWKRYGLVKAENGGA